MAGRPFPRDERMKMAGPSGAGMVQSYLRNMRNSARRAASHEYRVALRRELAKHGRRVELAPFDCHLLCMSCGRLAEPEGVGGDPMRSTPSEPRHARCQACGAEGLADLRHTPTVQSLVELEEDDPNNGRISRLGRAARVAGAVSLFTGLGFLALLATANEIGGPLMLCLFFPLLVLLSLPLLPARTTSVEGGRRLPRRWRLPAGSFGVRARSWWRRRHGTSGRAHTDAPLLRAPLSNRPCLAYEIAVRDDPQPDESLSSWRLVEQTNVAFRVGEVAIPSDGALLELPRELSRAGFISKLDERGQRFMRMRGLLDTEDVYIYETIVEPAAELRVEPGNAGTPPTLRAAA